jgi:hypothetical protein
MWSWCIKPEHSYMSFRKMYHPFKYLGYWICINIVHINLTWDSCDFSMSPWKSNFPQNLYKPMKPSKFVMSFLCNLWYELIKIPFKTWKCPKIIEWWLNINTTRKNNVYECTIHHKLNGSQFGNNSSVKSTFQRFV